ncbi:MAG: hypothetical protein ABJH05_06950 [Fulvivirga sp.]
MKTIVKLLMKKTWLLVAIGMFAVACNDSELDLISNESEEAAISEAEIDAVYEDVDDIASLSIQFSAANDGGKIAENPDDDRFCEDVFSFEGDKHSGTITLDFGDGCIDRNGNVRKGKIIVEYMGGKLVPGSKIVTTLVDYSINNIEIKGVRTLENISESLEDYPTYHITLVGGEVIWPDGTNATREVDKVRVWVNANNPLNDEHHVTGTANGKTRRDVNYDMVITDTLVYKRACRVSRRGRLPVAGTKVITTDNKIITIDFGDGECDKRVEITVDGNREEVTVD